MEGTPQHPENNIENLSDWRKRKEEAFSEATTILEANGFNTNLEIASITDIDKIMIELPGILDTIEFDKKRKERNENKYLAQVLSIFLEKARRKQSFQKLEMPLAA